MYMWHLPALRSSLEGRQTSIIPACQLLSTMLNFFSGFSPLAHINLEYITVRTLAVIFFYRQMISPQICVMKQKNIYKSLLIKVFFHSNIAAY